MGEHIFMNGRAIYLHFLCDWPVDHSQPSCDKPDENTRQKNQLWAHNMAVLMGMRDLFMFIHIHDI